jgi:dienelactone hydrolase
MADTQDVQVSVDNVILQGILGVPEGAKGLVLFAHGSGSGRLSPRNNQVAQYLRDAGLATLLFDLLTEDEEVIDDKTRELRFDIPFLAHRLIEVTQWVRKQTEAKDLGIGYFGASTGAGAALIAAAELKDAIKSVVSRGGRPDLADEFLPKVVSPTLLIVGGDDEPVIGMNEEALAKLKCEKKLEIVPGATHLFEEPGTLEKVSELAKDWFIAHF